ncbi:MULTISPECIES: hypothetical protein [unclassified Streptomyces]|uniref:hypothetical protein n=1 Tax=unclassified Streptomyces TaxID=2593676 RepID=UPI0022526893|nr:MULTISPECIES: hypothetical protein [unclassified Streptomyces]MCX5053151.1 hypothetical protein [Streptomyces sp. NBC_00474]MCX5059579.1 hypothetical protein [Streptomyces sp. NBC_00452]
MSSVVPCGVRRIHCARVAADALFGVHRALIAHVRQHVLSDDSDGEPSRLATDVHRLAERGFALLEGGLRAYGAKGRDGAPTVA